MDKRTQDMNLRLLVHDLESRGYIADHEGATVAFTYDTGYEDLTGPMVTARVDFGTRTARVTVNYNSPHVENGSAQINFSHMDKLAEALDELYGEL